MLKFSGGIANLVDVTEFLCNSTKLSLSSTMQKPVQQCSNRTRVWTKSQAENQQFVCFRCRLKICPWCAGEQTILINELSAEWAERRSGQEDVTTWGEGELNINK